MKRRALLILIPLAATVLACQTATSIFNGKKGEIDPADTAAVSPTQASPATAENSPEAPTEAVVGGQVDPCSLLTNSEVEDVYGQPPGEPVAGTFDYVALGPVPSCTWPDVRLELSLPIPPQGQSAEAYYKEYIRRMNPSEFPQGLGDEAWADPQDGDLLVRDGEFFFMLEEHTFESGVYERTQQLAEQILVNVDVLGDG
ncbi:MAG: hypothetical protein ACLFWD_03330 [Anaerolineales bacterium]